MIVWINGTFGVGKTTTTRSVAERTGWRTFDPEHVGYLLAGNLRDLDFDDFQDLPPWRVLVPAVMDEIHRYTNPEALVATQTVLVEEYWAELLRGLNERGLRVHHVLLDCDEAELRRRIEADEDEADARTWRLDHIAQFEDARRWLTSTADMVLDTTGLSAQAVAEAVISDVRSSDSNPR